MAYYVRIQRNGVHEVRAGLFSTLQEAQAFAATLQPKLLAAVVSIVEIGDIGDETRTIEFCDAQKSEQIEASWPDTV